MIDISTGKQMVGDGRIGDILSSGIAPAIVRGDAALQGSANASVGGAARGMMRMTGARNAAMFCKKILPSEYEEVKYLQSSGHQSIDTRVVRDINNNIYRFITNTSFANVTYRQLQGVQGYIYSGVVIGFCQMCQMGNGHLEIPITPDKFYYLDFTANKIENLCYGYVNNISFSYYHNYFQNTPEDATFNIFSLNGRNLPCTCKNKKVLIYVNGVLVRDFIPCYRKYDLMAGMYDTITKSFFTNTWDGTFGYEKFDGTIVNPT